MQDEIVTLAHDTRHTTHDTRHTTHDTRHTTHDTRHTTHDTPIADTQYDITGRINHAQSSDEIIHVALAIYDPSGTYSQHAGVVMTSIFENTTSKVIVHILHDDTLTDDNRQRFIRTAEKYSQGLEFHNIAEHNDMISRVPAEFVKNWTIGALFRAFVPDMLHDINKIIYLDCDVVVNLDILELWSINLNGKSVAGVRDNLSYASSYSIYGTYIRLSGCNNKQYINSGVIIMNLDKIRKSGQFSVTFIDWMLRHLHLFTWGDQSAINSIFRDDIELIDPKFNFYKPGKDISDCIFHMYFGGKAWKVFTGQEYQCLYWKLWLSSEWGKNTSLDEMLELLCTLANSPQVQEHYHMNSRICLRCVTASIIRRICNPFRIAAIIIKDMYYRFKLR